MPDVGLQRLARLVDLALARGFGEQVELQGTAGGGHAGAGWERRVQDAVLVF